MIATKINVNQVCMHINYAGALFSVPGTPNIIQFSLMSEDPVVFTLTFNTTGGPATYVTWTINGNNVSTLEGSRYEPSQIVVPNDRLYTAGDYSNILTVSRRLPGEYGVSVTNDRTSQSVNPTADITIIGIYLKGCAQYVSKILIFSTGPFHFLTVRTSLVQPGVTCTLTITRQ